MIIDHLFLEFTPHALTSSSLHWNPYSNVIINVPSVVWDKGGRESFEDTYFVDSKVDSSVQWAWWLSHFCAGSLFPVGVTQGEHVVAHNDTESRNECFYGDVSV